MAERSGGRVHRRSRAGIGFLTPTAQADMSSRGQRGRAVSTRPPDCGGRGHGFRTAIPTSATAAGLVRGMKLSSFLGWRSRTLTAAFTARNHEEQSRTARGMRHARPRPHAVGLPRPNPLDRVTNPAAATAATTSPASSRNTATPSSRAAAYPRRLPEGEVVQHPRQMPSALWQRHPCEHARDLERIICVDLAPNPAPSASATWIFRLAPPGFSYRRRRRGQGTGSNPAEPAPVASKLARPQRFFNHLRMLTATSRSP
jgi:hypothetical protein